MGWAEQRECVQEMWHERAWKWGRVRCDGMGEKEHSERRGRPLGRWEDKVKEYVSEREARRKGLEWAKEGVFHCVCIGRGGNSSAEATLLRGRFRRERGVGAID